ncbi:unnamed protein product, partial [Musa hybrid cultivar]
MYRKNTILFVWLLLDMLLSTTPTKIRVNSSIKNLKILLFPHEALFFFLFIIHPLFFYKIKLLLTFTVMTTFHHHLPLRIE